MDEQAFTELEAAAFAAWPALLPDEMFMGWRLRVSGGSTKRTNSANAGIGAADLGPEQIAEVERRYRARGLPVIFRIPSVAQPPRIDGVLQDRGYALADPTWVMSLALPAECGETPEPLSALDAAAWAGSYAQITQSQAPGLAHLEMIRAGNQACALAVELHEGLPVCCGIGVVSQGRLGLFALATAPAQLRKGFAMRLCARLMRWGRAQGAAESYLQVIQANAGAVALYRKLGFSPAYHYWYRVLA